jgi:hypothetical protein
MDRVTGHRGMAAASTTPIMDGVLAAAMADYRVASVFPWVVVVMDVGGAVGGIAPTGIPTGTPRDRGIPSPIPVAL